jgi:hypothetical protein
MIDICKLCNCHNGMQQFPPKYYYEKLPYGVTIVDCEFCCDTYEYDKKPNDTVTERRLENECD